MEDATIRLNKFLANLGICARRDVKGLLKAQMVTVNGVRAKEPGTRIDPQKDEIKLNGEKIKPPKMVYYLLNKPKGVVSTTADEFGRKNVTAYVPSGQRVYPVGRLDKETTGLLLLTNDGALTNLLIHPRYHVSKVYRLTITGIVDQPQLDALRKGVLLDDGITAPAKVIVLKQTHQEAYLEMTIHEGRNRQIRRMCETVGIKLIELDRVKFGPLDKGSLKPGKFRALSPQDIQLLRNAAGH
jgi:23S rRNA pseudouridine2605 synthase